MEVQTLTAWGPCRKHMLAVSVGFRWLGGLDIAGIRIGTDIAGQRLFWRVQPFRARNDTHTSSKSNISTFELFKVKSLM